MRRTMLAVALLGLLALLAACQQPKPVDLRPQLDVISASATAASDGAARAVQLTEGIASDLDVLTAGVTALRADVQALSGEAQALASVPESVAGLQAVVDRLDPGSTAMLSVNYPPGLQLTITTGACEGDLPTATELPERNETRSIVRLGLPAGPVCVTSLDPPAQLEVNVTAGQMQGVYFHAPEPEPDD